VVQVQDLPVPLVAAGVDSNTLPPVVDLYPVPVSPQPELPVGVAYGYGIAAGFKGDAGTLLLVTGRTRQ